MEGELFETIGERIETPLGLISSLEFNLTVYVDFTLGAIKLYLGHILIKEFQDEILK